jgi:hypothetical protein
MHDLERELPPSPKDEKRSGHGKKWIDSQIVQG